AAYLGKLVAPIGLNAVYEFYSVTSAGDIRFLISLGVTALFVAFFLVFLKRRERLAVFTLLWICLPLLPVLYVPALATVAFADRYLYLPSAGFALLSALILVSLLRYSVKVSRHGSRVVFMAVLLTLILYLAGTLTRAQVWQSNYSLWTDTVVKSPRNPDVRYNLAWTYHELGRVAEAEVEYRETLRLNPSIDEARFNLTIIYLERGDERRAYRELVTLRDRNPEYTEASRLIREIEKNNGWGGG
ncbi:MAG: hypothetical protein GY771_04155, partial [bacterium]|nr:hypothetical protein [bacterium]